MRYLIPWDALVAHSNEYAAIVEYLRKITPNYSIYLHYKLCLSPFLVSVNLLYIPEEYWIIYPIRKIVLMHLILLEDWDNWYRNSEIQLFHSEILQNASYWIFHNYNIIMRAYHVLWFFFLSFFFMIQIASLCRVIQKCMEIKNGKNKNIGKIGREKKKKKRESISESGDFWAQNSRAGSHRAGPAEVRPNFASRWFYPSNSIFFCYVIA